MTTTSKAFRDYALFSTQVDQYYAATRIFARHYEPLKAAHLLLPDRKDMPNDPSCLSQTARNFFIKAVSALN